MKFNTSTLCVLFTLATTLTASADGGNLGDIARRLGNNGQMRGDEGRGRGDEGRGRGDEGRGRGDEGRDHDRDHDHDRDRDHDHDGDRDGRRTGPINWPTPWPSRPSWPTRPSPWPTQPSPWPTQPSPWPTQPSPWPTQPSPWPGQSQRIVEENVQRYFDYTNTLDLLADVYVRNQLYGFRIAYVKVTMSSSSGRDMARLLINTRQIQASTMVDYNIREYILSMDPMANQVGFSLGSLMLETQNRFFVEKVTFVLQ